MLTNGVVVAALLGVVVSHASAQTGNLAADEATIRRLEDQQRLAVLHRDLASLDRLWSDDLILNPPTNQVFVGKQAVLDRFFRNGRINLSSLETQIEVVRIDGDYAVVMGAEAWRSAGSDPSSEPSRRRYTDVWKRTGDTWRLLWRHDNVIPPR